MGSAFAKPTGATRSMRQMGLMGSGGPVSPNLPTIPGTHQSLDLPWSLSPANRRDEILSGNRCLGGD
jgi:hypothetical protein